MTTSRNDLPSALTRGRLEGVSVPELLCDLCRTGRTGVLHITRGAVTKTIYIDAGRVVFATSGDPDDRLGETLLREDVITLDQLRRAVERLRKGKRLGTLLVEIAAITPQDLVNGVLSQIHDIIMGLFPLEEGEYRFDEGDLPTEELITVNMKMEELLLQGIRQVRSFSRIRQAVGPPRTRYRRTASAHVVAEKLDLSEGEKMLLDHLDDRGSTVEELCRRVFLSNFEIYQALWAFRVLGAVEEADRAAKASEEAAVEGRLGTEGIGPTLVHLCQEGETGVLYVSRDAVDRAFHLREGRCAFATSSNIDDGLIAHLLRRGVISLRDREETAKRLLSNKRVGTILREMGVIDDRDLEGMVREQLGEVLFDTFRWDRGEYAFVQGELPTFEEITLDLSVEDIVAQGVRRVTSWTRVREGCGGLEVPQALAPGYLETLDRMSIGQEEWEVVAALRTPRSVADLCREIDLGDFRVCQIVWTLRMLGTLESAEAVEADEAPGVEATATEAVSVAEQAEPTGETEPVPMETASAADDAPEADASAADPVRVRDEDDTEVEEPTEAVPAGPVLAWSAEDDPATEESLEARPVAEPPSGADDMARLDTDFPRPVPDESDDAREAALTEPDAFEIDEPGAGTRYQTPEDVEQEDVPRSAAAGPDPDWQVGVPGADSEPEEEGPAEPEPSFEIERMEAAEEIDTFTGLVSDQGPETGGDHANHDAFEEPPAEPVDRFEAAHPIEEFADEPHAYTRRDPMDDPSSTIDDLLSEGDGQPGSGSDVDSDLEAPPIDSPLDATQYIPREEVEALLDPEADDVELGPRIEPEASTSELSRHEVEAALDYEEVARAGTDPAGPHAESAADESNETEDELEPAEPIGHEDEPRVAVEAATVDAADAAMRDPAEPTNGNGHGPEHVDDELEPLITRFNAMQRVVYRSIRSEVGAGAANFVRACGGCLEDRIGRVFANVELGPDGAWDPTGLRQALEDERVDEPWDGFRQLIDEEIERLRMHIGDARVQSLQERLDTVDA